MPNGYLLFKMTSGNFNLTMLRKKGTYSAGGGEMIFKKRTIHHIRGEIIMPKGKGRRHFFSKCMATNDWFGKMTKPNSYFLIPTSVFAGRVRVGNKY